MLLMKAQVLSISKHCWFRSTVEINPLRFLSPRCCSPSLPKSFSLYLSLSPSCLIPHHDLPGLISHKNLMICMFDYHWSTINVWGHIIVSLRRLLTIIILKILNYFKNIKYFCWKETIIWLRLFFSKSIFLFPSFS